MVRMIFAYVLYPKIFHHKGKTDGAPLVGPKAWCDITLVVAMLSQALGKELLSK